MSTHRLFLKAEDLRLGDVVKCFDGPWSTAIVVKVAPSRVVFHRPYGVTADFCQGSPHEGSVISYVGNEQFEVFLPCSNLYFVYERKELK